MIGLPAVFLWVVLLTVSDTVVFSDGLLLSPAVVLTIYVLRAENNNYD